MDKYSYFTDEEIRCNCGCGVIQFQPRFYFKMNLLRLTVGQILRVTSWTRCQPHNASVGGKVTSSHPKGWASDLEAISEYMKFRIAFCAGLVGFRGIGIGKLFVHLDDDPEKAPDRLWIY